MLESIKKLRALTSLGVSDCKKALEESNGDFDKALELLKKRGIEINEKRKDRIASQGVIEAYIHFNNKVGALVEVNCETDFVANTDVFKNFAKDIALQVAATEAKYIKKEDIPEEKLKEIEDLDKFIKEYCLLNQQFIKDPTITINEYLNSIVSKTGEKVVIKRFVRFVLGE